MSERELRERADALCDEVGALTFDTIQDGEWRIKIALELNCLLGYASYHLDMTGDDADIKFAEAALSIARRVAEFEDIKEKE